MLSSKALRSTFLQRRHLVRVSLGRCREFEIDCDLLLVARLAEGPEAEPLKGSGAASEILKLLTFDFKKIPNHEYVVSIPCCHFPHSFNGLS